MNLALRAEWTKFRTVPAAWLPLVAAALTVIVAAAVTAAVDPAAAPCSGRCDLVELSLSGVRLGQIAVVAHATLVMTAEYDTGSIVTTLLAVPRRHQVLAAKAAVVATTAMGGGLLGAGASLVIGRIQLTDGDPAAAQSYQSLALTDAATLRAAAGSVLYLALVALATLGVATILRSTTGALTAVLGLLYVLPLAALVVPSETWQQAISRYAPMSAGLAIQAADAQPGRLGPWAGLGLLAAYAGAALLGGGALLAHRDA
jgi:ABC-2 type transport system permease protein